MCTALVLNLFLRLPAHECEPEVACGDGICPIENMALRETFNRVVYRYCLSVQMGACGVQRNTRLSDRPPPCFFRWSERSQDLRIETDSVPNAPRVGEPDPAKVSC